MATIRSHRSGIWFAETAAVVDTNIYAAGDLVGGKLTYSNFAESGVAGSLAGGIIQSVVITDLAKQSTNKDVIFFDTDPSNTTYTENAALDVDDADLLNIIGVAQVTTWVDFGDNSVGQVLGLEMPFAISAGTSLFAAMVERGTPTFGATGDISVRVGVLPM